MAVNYKIYDSSQVGESAVAAADSSLKVEIGTVSRGRDFSTSAYGEAEFMYVAFTGTTAAGDFVMVDRYAKTAVQASQTTPPIGTVGISMAAQAASQWGWVMIRGIHDSANVATGSTVGGKLYLTATAGRANTTVAAGKGLDGVTVKTTPSSNVATVELTWASFNGNG